MAFFVEMAKFVTNIRHVIIGAPPALFQKVEKSALVSGKNAMVIYDLNFSFSSLKSNKNPGYYGI